MDWCRSVVVGDNHIEGKMVSDLLRYEHGYLMQIPLLVSVWPSLFACSQRRFINIVRFLGSIVLFVHLFVDEMQLTLLV